MPNCVTLIGFLSCTLRAIAARLVITHWSLSGPCMLWRCLPLMRVASAFSTCLEASLPSVARRFATCRSPYFNALCVTADPRCLGGPVQAVCTSLLACGNLHVVALLFHTCALLRQSPVWHWDCRFTMHLQPSVGPSRCACLARGAPVADWDFGLCLAAQFARCRPSELALRYARICETVAAWLLLLS